jgi:hypothetical protein
MKLLMQVTVVAALAMVPAGQALANGWVACAGEDQYCSVPGTRMVRYGAGDRWSMKLATRQIRCSNEVFGDPAPGRQRHAITKKSRLPTGRMMIADHGQADLMAIMVVG